MKGWEKHEGRDGLHVPNKLPIWRMGQIQFYNLVHVFAVPALRYA
jgi:hypothetical protein